MTTALVFGTFDVLHPGHAHFLAEAKALADRLVVCLATDETVRRLKGRGPRQDFATRQQALRLLPVVDDVVAGDETEGVYTAVATLQPDIIAFGYDQQTLHDDCVKFLDAHGIPAHTIFLSAFEPDKYKSSLLRRD